MSRPVESVEVTEDELEELLRRVASATVSRRDHLRAEIVLRRVEGVREADVAAELGIGIACVSKWSKRFSEEGLAGLKDRSGRGRKPRLPAEAVEKVVTKVTQPPRGRKRWSTRSMAREAGISHQSVHRLWRETELKPHRTRTFKLSNDPHFEEKFWDVIGLYLDPPEKALVLCCDEKSQCQALERSQPGLPLDCGHVRTRTHDYKRHGTVTLFAALDYLEGKLHSRTEERHTHVEWLRFLKQLNRETDPELDIHLIVDNYATHKHPKVLAWLERHPRFHLHFTPTSSSWLNLVERFFADLTADVVREGSFTSVRELCRDIEDYLAERNLNPRPYKWRASGEDILGKIKRARAALEASKRR